MKYLILVSSLLISCSTTRVVKINQCYEVICSERFIDNYMSRCLKDKRRTEQDCAKYADQKYCKVLHK